MLRFFLYGSDEGRLHIIDDPQTEALRLHLYFEMGCRWAHDYELPVEGEAGR